MKDTIAKRYLNIAFYIMIFKSLSLSVSVLSVAKSAKGGCPKISFHNINQLSLNNYQSKGSWFNFVHFVVKLPNMKTKPKQTQTKPIFRTTNLDFSEKTRILDKFRQHFLCKTKPNNVIGKSMSCQKRLIMQNEPNLNIFFTSLTNEAKRAYSDFCQKNAKKQSQSLHSLHIWKLKDPNNAIQAQYAIKKLSSAMVYPAPTWLVL